MGYMTTLTFLNDGFDQIEEYPEQFINAIKLGMYGINKHIKNTGRKFITTHSIGYYGNSVEVAKSHHADDYRLYLVGRNTMTTFGYANEINDIKYRKELVEMAKWIIKDEEKRIEELKENKEINKNGNINR